MKALPVLTAACCAMVLAGCGNPPNETALGDIDPPVVSLPETTPPPAPSEPVILADRLLRRESGALLMEAERRRALAREIGSVLSRIRDAYPATAEVTALQTHAPGTILVALEPELFDTVSGLRPSRGRNRTRRAAHRTRGIRRPQCPPRPAGC